MISVVFDHAQKRTAFDRIGLLAGGLDLNGEFWENAWIEPNTKSLMLRPPPLDAAWFTSNAGNYEKWAAADYTLTTAAKWKEIERHAGAGPWLLAQDVNETVITATALDKNVGVYLAYLCYGSGDNFVQMECGWSNGGDGSSGVSLRFWSGGEVEFWHDGVLIEVGKISGSRTRMSSQNVVSELMLIPGRRRELIVWSSRGDGHVFVLPWIEEDDADPTITDAEKFWWYVPVGKADVQAAKLQYPTTGYATSLRYFMAEPPELTDVFEQWDNPAWAGGAAQDFKISGDEPYVGTVTAEASLVDPDDGSTPFVPDGTLRECRIRVDMTSTGESSPFIYAAQLGFERVSALTFDAEFDAIGSIYEATLSVPESPADVELELSIDEPQNLEADVPKVAIITNRPIALRIAADPDPITVLDGFGGTPEWDESTLDDGQRYGRSLRLTVRDRWASLENYMFRERVDLSDMLIEDALAFIVKRTGVDDADLDIEATGVRLGDVAPKECGTPPVVIEVGDTAAEWVQNICDDYAAGFFYGFVPTALGVVFQFASADGLGTTPELTLYESTSDAQAVFPGEDGSQIWARLYHSYRQTTLSPMANDVRVTGQDPRTNEPFQTYKGDAASQDPTTDPALRPDNWLGEKRMRGLIDPAITTQGFANDVTDFLFDRLSVATIVVEWRSTLLLRADGAPVWRGQVVALDGKGLFRVRSISCQFELEDDEGETKPVVRSCVYTGEYVGEIEVEDA